MPKYGPINLAIPIQPGQERDPSRDAIYQKIQDAINELYGLDVAAPVNVTSITDTSKVSGDVTFSGAGVVQSGQNFDFAGSGGSGTVTSVGAVAPIVAAPNPITGAGTLSHAASGVAAATYTNPTIGVDIFGHILTAVNGSAGPVTSGDAFSHTVTAAKMAFWIVQLSPGDTIPLLPQLIGAPDRGYLAIYGNRSLVTVNVTAAAGNTVNGGASLSVINGATGVLIGVAGAGSNGAWSGFAA